MNKQNRKGSYTGECNPKNYSRNYEIRRTPDDKPNWFFQVVNNKLINLSKRGAFNIVAVCDSGAPEQIVFSIPYAYLKDHILPYAHLEANGRYLFNINKETYKFNWSRNVKMDGREFLAN